LKNKARKPAESLAQRARPAGLPDDIREALITVGTYAKIAERKARRA